jgi:mono/diheme cytochrome c family protein
MPGFANVLSDAQFAALLGYVRSHFSAGPAWTGIDDDIRTARQTRPAQSPAPAADPAAADPTKHEARQ